jgi:hypothetical protein
VPEVLQRQVIVSRARAGGALELLHCTRPAPNVNAHVRLAVGSLDFYFVPEFVIAL